MIIKNLSNIIFIGCPLPKDVEFQFIDNSFNLFCIIQTLIINFKKQGIRNICLFIINIYIKACFNAFTTKFDTEPRSKISKITCWAQKNWLQVDYKQVAQKALIKIINHLWYLNSIQIAFLIFRSYFEKRKWKLSWLKN